MKIFFGTLAGGIAGAVLCFLGKCAEGNCPFVRDPAVTIGVFAIAGAMLTALTHAKK